MNPADRIPNVQQYTTGASERKQILLALVLAFGIDFFAKLNTAQGKKTSSADVWIAAKGQSIAAWIVLIVILSMASDFDSTRQLSVAFAWLILIVALLGNGSKAIGNVSNIIKLPTK